MVSSKRFAWAVPTALLVLAGCSGSQDTAADNPCAANPCAANPCAANPCGGGTSLDPSLVTQGDRALNSGGNSQAQLVAMGEELWADASLSSAGTTSCATCHVGTYAMMNPTFANAYPHPVAMAKDRAGLDEVTAAEMVQLCMVVPMQAEPLEWNSVELAALSAYVESIQPGFDAAA
ncbi:MAG: cytochrome c peroxidase, partial [Gemmatimonadota bacterium]